MRLNNILYRALSAISLGILLLGSGLGASEAHAMSAEDLVAKHIEARGGDQWKNIESFSLHGNFTAFSKVHPFVQHRTQDGKFYMDHILDDKQVVMGFDGETPWWAHGWFGDWPTRVADLDRSVFLQEVDFPNVLFHLDDGFELDYKGEGEIDGMDALVLELTRPDDWKETWYFDPETYLELARETTGSDFGRPSEQLSIFDDFRDVSGVKIPHYVEHQWYTRNRVWEVQKVEINGTIDETLFSMPGPTGMDDFHQLAGSWQVKVESRQQPGAPLAESASTAEVSPRLRGSLWELTYESPDARQVVSQLTYDRFGEVYRWVTIDDTSTYLDIQEGVLEEGRLTVSNLDTSTRFETFGMTVKERNTLSEISADGFTLETESSVDGGENWFVSSKMTFERSP